MEIADFMTAGEGDERDERDERKRQSLPCYGPSYGLRVYVIDICLLLFVAPVTPFF